MNQTLIQRLPVLTPEAGFQEKRTILDGHYDFTTNHLTLDVEICKTDEATGESKKEFEKRVFEITSLKVTVKGEDRPTDIQLLGARTENAMKQVMPQIIRNFQEYVNTDLFLSRSLDGRVTRKKALFARKKPGSSIGALDRGHLVTTTSFSLKTPTPGLATEGGDSWSLENTLSSDNLHAEKVADNSAVLMSLLSYVNWEGLIQEAQNPEKPEQEWDPSYLTGMKPSPMLRAVADAVSEPFKAAAKKYNDFQSIMIPSLRDHIGFLETSIAELNQFVQDHSTPQTAGDESLNSDDYGILSTHKRDLEGKLLESKNLLIQLKRTLLLQEDLAVMVSIYHIDKLGDFSGKAPMGATLTRDWDHLVSHYNLVPADIENIEADQRDAYLQDHLSQKLGLRINPVVDYAANEAVIKREVFETKELIKDQLDHRARARDMHLEFEREQAAIEAEQRRIADHLATIELARQEEERVLEDKRFDDVLFPDPTGIFDSRKASASRRASEEEFDLQMGELGDISEDEASMSRISSRERALSSQSTDSFVSALSEEVVEVEGVIPDLFGSEEELKDPFQPRLPSPAPSLSEVFQINEEDTIESIVDPLLTKPRAKAERKSFSDLLDEFSAVDSKGAQVTSLAALQRLGASDSQLVALDLVESV